MGLVSPVLTLRVLPRRRPPTFLNPARPYGIPCGGRLLRKMSRRVIPWACSSSLPSLLPCACPMPELTNQNNTASLRLMGADDRLYGVTILQTLHYFDRFYNDSRFSKLLVRPARVGSAGRTMSLHAYVSSPIPPGFAPLVSLFGCLSRVCGD